MDPARSGYAGINGVRLYHEVYGSGEPLVLIHGGLTTIGEMQGWVQPLAETRQVIAVELQGHGHTAETDRPMTLPTLGDDIAALLDHLGIARPTWRSCRCPCCSCSPTTTQSRSGTLLTSLRCSAAASRDRGGRTRGCRSHGWRSYPGYSQYNFLCSPEVPEIVAKFLADPLTNPTAETNASAVEAGKR